MNIDVLSFARFAHRIFDSAGGYNSEILDDTGKNLILNRVAAQCDSELHVLKGFLKKQGYISEVKSILSEFIQYEIEPDSLLSIENDPMRRFLKEKLKDISILYKAFRDILGTEYITKEELLDKAEKAAKKADFLKNSEIYLDNFTGFTPIQYRFLSRLFDFADSFYFALPYDGKDGELFSMSIESIGQLRRISHEKNYNISTIKLYDGKNRRYKHNKELDHLEKNLFRKGAISYKEKPENIKIISADSPQTEAAYVCNEILKLIKNNNMRFKDIGIVMSDTAGYGRLLKKEADRLSIPIFIDTMRDILLNPITEILRSAIEVECEGFSYEAVFRYLRSGLAPFPPEDVDYLDSYARAMNIRGRKQYQKEFLHTTGDFKEDDLPLLNKTRQGFSDLFTPLDRAMIKRNATASDYTKALQEFLEKGDMENRLSELSESFKKNGDIDLSEQYDKLWEKIQGLFDRILTLIPSERMTMREYLDVLNAGFDELRIGLIPPGPDRVNAGDLTRSRFSDIKALFFLGLNDGLIPQTTDKISLISDFEREYLLTCGMRLSPTLREKVGLEKLYFYMGLAKPSERLYLSYSRGSDEGGVSRRSAFLRSIEQLFPALEEKKLELKDIRGEINCDNDGLEILSSLLNSAPNDKGRTLWNYCHERSSTAGKMGLVKKAAFEPIKNSELSKAVASALYGDMSSISPTRLERYALCAYQHFLLYGLKADEEEEFRFDSRDFGSILHGALEYVSEWLKKHKKNFFELKSEEVSAISNYALEQYLNAHEYIVLKSSKRNQYALTRIERTLKRTLDILIFQAGAGLFKNTAFEKNFHSHGFYGRIDRIDSSSVGNKLYLSITDYKSGNKEFDLSRIYHGLDLQLIIYMDAALEMERQAHPHTDIRPAGLFYYHLDDPYIESSKLESESADEVSEKLKEKLKLRGLVNDDPEVIRLFDQRMGSNSLVIPVSFKKDGSLSEKSSALPERSFTDISRHAGKLKEKFLGEITNGHIDASPSLYDNESACKYCAFKECCSFKEGLISYRPRRLKKYAKAQDVLSAIEQDHP
ncbi:MAG: PD-(D/E)XK nuclease family protein [Lachnospiraceae bacterium]|nr:PD-(D/E)XK nuclease family protein [Lachnospiraceae bacterium]